MVATAKLPGDGAGRGGVDMKFADFSNCAGKLPSAALDHRAVGGATLPRLCLTRRRYCWLPSVKVLRFEVSNPRGLTPGTKAAA